MNPAIFNPDLLQRAGWAVAIIAGGLALYWLLNRYILVRAERSQASQDGQVPGAKPGTPAILYFTTPDCAPCRTVQRPALRALQERLGEQSLQVIEVNVQEQPDLASRWGVLSVPTTFIIGADGRLKHVNHGVTRAERLLEQIGTR